MRSLGDEMATPLPSKGEKDANAGKPGERAPTAGGLIPEEEAFDQAASESVFADAIRKPMSNSAPGCGCPMAAKVRHCTGRAGRPCRIVTRWCAFAPKVDSCARPPAA